jgi:putative component of membrane protein insertase Oxa1/YidC/SpoIIIJ protein YidD
VPTFRLSMLLYYPIMATAQLSSAILTIQSAVDSGVIPEGAVRGRLPNAKSTVVSDFVRQAALTSIHAYQVHLSPMKGFTCLYRCCYGGLSCSAYVGHLLLEESSLSMVFSQTLQRFRSCATASNLINSESSETQCWIIPCCLTL